MANRYSRPSSSRAPEPIEISGSEELYSASEEEPTQQELNDRRLAQAVNYLRTEGGEGSPTTFISRVNRINEALVQSLPKQGRNFDPGLHRQVRTLVQKIQHDYEAATDECFMQLDNEEVLPESYVPEVTEEALYREESPPPDQAPKTKAHTPRRPGDDEDVEREREFKYGGPHNEVEYWHKNFPDSLPFPETHLMAHWESLKIDYDLSRSNEDTAVETNVPFDHPHLLPYFHLAQYESGSRFRHPEVSEENARKVSRYGTVEQLRIFVEAFNRGDDINTSKKDFAPRIFLEKFSVGNQLSPNITANDIRQSVNVTPTRAPTPSVGGTGTIPSNFIRGSPRGSPVARRISTAVRKSIDTTLPSTAPPTIKRVATSVVIPKRPRGRPRKHPLPVQPFVFPDVEEDYEEPATSSSKRKPSAGSRAFVPSALGLKMKTRATKKVKTAGKKVEFVDEVGYENKEPTPTTANATGGAKAAATVVAKVTAGEAVEGAKVSKAVAAGKRAKKSSITSTGGAKAGTTRSGANFHI